FERVIAAKAGEVPLVVALALEATLHERREGAHGAAVARRQPPERLSTARVLRDRLHILRPIGLIAPHAAGRDRPVEALAPVFVLADDLRRPHLALDVIHPRDLRADALVLEVACLDARAVIRRAVVHAVERETRTLTEHRAQVCEPAPQNALRTRLSGKDIDRLGFARRVPAIGQGTKLVVFEIGAERV